MLPNYIFRGFSYILLMLMVFLISTLSLDAVGLNNPKWNIYKIIAIIILFVVLLIFTNRDDNAKKNTENLKDIKLIADLMLQRDGMRDEKDKKNMTYLIDEQVFKLIPYKKRSEKKEDDTLPQDTIDKRLLGIRLYIDENVIEHLNNK